MSKNWSGFSEVNGNTTPLGLVDIAECEDLIQQNKSEKKHQDSEQVLEYIETLKRKEADFYMSLNLEERIKRDLFKVPPRQEDFAREAARNLARQDLVLLQHPIDGNLIMTERDMNERFGDQIMHKKF